MTVIMKAVFIIAISCFIMLNEGNVWAAPIEPIIPKRPDASHEEPRITVILQRTYLDGEVSEEVFTENPQQLEQVLRQYKDWQIIDRDDVEIVLQKRINDISPLLKTSGYFGVSKEGILQIFKGMPSSDHVIQSFFQIDTKKLKTDRRQQLEKGIRIESKERFAEVLEEMKSYSNLQD